MKKYVNANLDWITPECGGRKNPVKNQVKYCPIIVFKNKLIENSNWSAEIYCEVKIEKYRSKIRLSFLSDDAPFEFLHTGTEFDLFEGSMHVARGIII